MHQTSLDMRNTEARRRIAAAAASLGDALGLAPLVTPTAIEQRQPAVAQMRELEGIAALLEAIAQEMITNGTEERPR